MENEGGSQPQGVSSANPSGAVNAAEYQLLKNQLTAEEIAGGHSFGKHVLTQGEYPGWIRTRAQFQSLVEDVINNPTAVRSLQKGRVAYWQEASGTVVIRNPAAADGGTAFQPVNGRAYFEGLK
jgi:filamentous hemagglutinin